MPKGGGFVGLSILQARERLTDAYDGLTGLHELLRRSHDLSGITGPSLAALLATPIGELVAAADELRAVSGRRARRVSDIPA